MTEINETQVDVSGQSKFAKVSLLIISVLLIFAGPTYIPYLISDIAHAGATVANVIGFLLFLAGIGMLVYTLRKKIVT